MAAASLRPRAFAARAAGSILLLLLPALPAAQTRPTIELPAALIVDQNAGTATGWLYIHNGTNTAQLLVLTASDFINAMTRQPLGAQAVFSQAGEAAGTPMYRATVAPQSTMQVKIAVSNLWEAGRAEALLLNRGEVLDTLLALKYRVPFAVKLEGMGSEQQAVSFFKGQRTTLLLKNDDGMTYPVDWSFEIGGKKTAGRLTLAPNGTAPVSISPDQWFTWGSRIRGLIKEDTRDAHLMLSLWSPDRSHALALPAKAIRMKATLSRYSANTRELASTLIIFVALALGGTCSLLMSHWVPNRVRRAELREQWETLHRKIRDLSGRIDSSLRVLLRVERLRLEKLIQKNRLTFSPQYASLLENTSKRLDTLMKRVDLLQQIDVLYQHLDKEQGEYSSQTLRTQTEHELRKACALLQRSEPAEKDLQDVQAAIMAAHSYLENFEQHREILATQIEQRLLELKEDAAGELGQSATWKEVSQKLPGLLKILQFAGKELDKQPVRQLCWIDANVSRLLLLRDYARLVESAFETGMRDKLKNLQSRLLEHLSLQSWEGLRAAQRLLRQMEEGLFAEDIETAIRKGAVAIKMEPNLVRQDQHARLSVRFHQEALNHATARDEFTCSWSFGHDDLQEKGWTVSHFFPEVKTYDALRVRFADGKGEAINDGNGREIVLPPDKPVVIQRTPDAGMGERTRTELIRLGIPLFAALVALIAGAKEQLLKLDILPGLIAVFLIGFGADTIKNLITRKE